MIVNSKKCLKCNEIKYILDYPKGKNVCKACTAIYKKNYYKNNKDNIKKYKKEYYKEYKNETIEHVKNYYKNNKDNIKEYHKVYCKNNKSEISDYKRMYRKRNVAKALYSSAKSRAKKYGIKFTITIDDIKDIIPVYNICCLLEIKMIINEGKVKYNSFTLDRIDHSKGYVKGNIQVISHKANNSKNNSTISEYDTIVTHYKQIIDNVNLIIQNGNNENINKLINIQQSFDSMKSRTKKYNLPIMNIDKAYLKLIYPKDNICPLLRIKLQRGRGIGGILPSSPTVDRLIPKLGYVRGNMMIISYKANRIKSNLTIDEMQLLLFNWKKGEVRE